MCKMALLLSYSAFRLIYIVQKYIGHFSYYAYFLAQNRSVLHSGQQTVSGWISVVLPVWSRSRQIQILVQASNSYWNLAVGKTVPLNKPSAPPALSTGRWRAPHVHRLHWGQCWTKHRRRSATTSTATSSTRCARTLLLIALDGPTTTARVNHVLKQWRPQQLPQLIHKLWELVYMEADRAVCGRGDLMLVPSAVRHRVSVDVWKQMSADRQ